jgi:hypothetical protein
MSLFVVFLVVVVVAGAVSYLVAQQRVRDIRAFASAHGMTGFGNSWDLGDCGFGLFRSGNRRYWRNVLRGQWGGLPVTYCDYSYVVQSGRNSQTYGFSNAIWPLGMQIPWVTVYAHRLPVAEIGVVLDATASVSQRIPALVRSRFGVEPPTPEPPPSPQA